MGKGTHSELGAALLAQVPTDGSSIGNKALREAIEYYQHDRGWANYLMAGPEALVQKIGSPRTKYRNARRSR